MEHCNQPPRQQWSYSPCQGPPPPGWAYPQTLQHQHYPQYPIPQQQQPFYIYGPNQYGQPAYIPQPYSPPVYNPPMYVPQPYENQQPKRNHSSTSSSMLDETDNVNNRCDFQPETPPIYLGGAPEVTTGMVGKDERGPFKVHIAFSNASVRAAFVRKVFCLVTIMLLVVSVMCAIPFLSKDVKMYLRRSVGLFYISLLLYLGISFAIACVPYIRRTFPINLFVAAALTLSLGFIAMTICSLYKGESVLLTLVITTLSCSGIIIFSMQTKYDFTKCVGIAIIAGWCLFVYGIVATIAAIFFHIRWLYLIYAFLGMLLCMVYLAIDTQMIIGGKQHEISPEEYILAAILIFTDIVTIFIFMLQLFGNES